MAGVDASNFATLSDFAHVEQSIGKILTTHIGERVHREFFGNPGLRLLGENITQETILRFYSICWALIELYEPRFRITRFLVEDADRMGTLEIAFEGEFDPFGHLEFVQAQAFISLENGTVRIVTAL